MCAHTIRPTWPLRRRIIEAHILARTARLSQDGWAGALAQLRPGTRWRGEGRLLMFVPVTPGHGWVSCNKPHRYAVMYPCPGVLAADTASVLGSVGRHLKILSDARLVRRHRAGRSVLYYQTPAGRTLIRAQHHQPI